MNNNKKKKTSRIVIHEEKNIPVLRGECPKCARGNKSLVIINFVKNTSNERLNMVKIKCVSCFKEYYKYVIELTKNGSKES